MKILFSPLAKKHLDELRATKSQKIILKSVLKTLALMEHDLRHSSLNTHEFIALKGPRGEKVFDAYAQQKTPGAYRIFWYYGPDRDIISVIAIIPHPNKKKPF